MSREEEHQPLLVSREENAEENCSESEAHKIKSRYTNTFSSTLMDRLEKLCNKPYVRARVGTAAHLIRDAAMDIDAENPSEGAYDPYHSHHPKHSWRNVTSVLCRRLCVYQPLLTLLNFVAWTMLLLTFIEPPYWCRRSEENPERSCAILLRAKGVPVGVENEAEIAVEVEYYPNSHAMLIDEGQSRQIESICVFVVIVFLLLRIGRDGFSLKCYFRKGPARWNRVIQLVSLCFIVAGLWKDHFGYRPYARLAIVMSLDNFGFQRELRDLVKVLPRVFQILALLGLLILFYGWFGTVMFSNTVEGKISFSNLIESIVRSLPAPISQWNEIVYYCSYSGFHFFPVDPVDVCYHRYVFLALIDSQHQTLSNKVL